MHCKHMRDKLENQAKPISGIRACDGNSCRVRSGWKRFVCSASWHCWGHGHYDRTISETFGKILQVSLTESQNGRLHFSCGRQRLKTSEDVLIDGQRYRIIIIKFADRLHNMRTLKYLDEDRRKMIARALTLPRSHTGLECQYQMGAEDLCFAIAWARLSETQKWDFR